MVLHGHDLSHTVGSAVVYNAEGQVALKETGAGLSLLGGYVDFRGGIESIQSRIQNKHRLGFIVEGINGIVQTLSATGKSVVNINLRGIAHDAADSDVIWIHPHEIMSRPEDCRTIDTVPLIERSFNSVVPLSFIHPTFFGRQQETTKPQTVTPGDFNVVGAVIQYQTPEGPRYPLMVCGREGRDRGKLSLFGGHLAGGKHRERIFDGLVREIGEEGGSRQVAAPVGYAGIFINLKGGGKSMTAITNIVGACIGLEEPTIPEEAADEVAEIRHYTIRQLMALPRDSFRTPDTRQAVILADRAFRGRSLAPLETIQYLETDYIPHLDAQPE